MEQNPTKNKRVRMSMVTAGVLIGLLAVGTATFAYFAFDQNNSSTLLFGDNLSALSLFGVENKTTLPLSEESANLSTTPDDSISSEKETGETNIDNQAEEGETANIEAESGNDSEEVELIPSPTPINDTEETTPNNTTEEEIVQEEPGLPNLTVTNIVVAPNPMDPDQPVRLTATVTNTGTGPALASVSTMTNLSNNITTATHPPYDLEPGQVFEIWEEDDYPFFATCENAGENRLQFTVDPQNNIEETDETDNSFEVAVQLAGCDQ